MDKAPFNKDYVLRITTRHMRRSADISIRKTFERMPEFQDDNDKKIEIMETLDVLHKLRKLLDDFQAANKHLFKDNNGDK